MSTSSSGGQTRWSILEAAWKRLSRPGDAARLEDIASDAGVTRQSLHLHFGTRGALLVALVQHIDGSLRLPERIAEIRACADPVQALERGLRLTARYEPEIHGAALALARLAPTDPEAAAALEDRMRHRRAGLAATLRAIKRRGLLAPGYTVREVVDILWVAGAPSTFHHLVVERRWPLEKFERRLLDLGRSFIRPPGPAVVRPRG